MLATVAEDRQARHRGQIDGGRRAAKPTADLDDKWGRASAARPVPQMVAHNILKNR
jgi:hypothetical protein